MGNPATARHSLLHRVTLGLAVGAGLGEAAAILAAIESVEIVGVFYIVLLAAPFGILAWMSHRYRDRRILKPLLFLTVLWLAAWGLSHLIDDAVRIRRDPDASKVSRWGPFVVVCGNWITLVAVLWAERFLRRFSRRKS